MGNKLKMKNDINIETVSKNLLSVLCPQSTVSQSVCGKIVTLCVKDMSQIPSLGSLVICSTDISNLKTANYHISKNTVYRGESTQEDLGTLNLFFQNQENKTIRQIRNLNKRFAKSLKLVANENKSQKQSEFPTKSDMDTSAMAFPQIISKRLDELELFESLSEQKISIPQKLALNVMFERTRYQFGIVTQIISCSEYCQVRNGSFEASKEEDTVFTLPFELPLIFKILLVKADRFGILQCSNPRYAFHPKIIEKSSEMINKIYALKPELKSILLKILRDTFKKNIIDGEIKTQCLFALMSTQIAEAEKSLSNQKPDEEEKSLDDTLTKHSFADDERAELKLILKSLISCIYSLGTLDLKTVGQMLANEANITLEKFLSMCLCLSVI